VACVGNSITEGYGLETTYPQALQQLLGEQYEVRNYGVSGRTLLKKGDFPYWNEAKYQEVLAWNPDVVVIKLGTNDSKPQNWQHKKDFVKDYVKLVKSFKKLPSKPKVYITYPIPVFENKWGITEAVVKNEILPAINKIARKAKVEIIDLNTPFIGQAALTYDGVHPNDEGAALLANEVYKVLMSAKKVSAR
jgi:lysophospholipase L1-like esterase